MKNIRERIEGFLSWLERAEALLLEGRVHRVEGLPRTYVVRGSENYLLRLLRTSVTFTSEWYLLSPGGWAAWPKLIPR